MHARYNTVHLLLYAYGTGGVSYREKPVGKSILFTRFVRFIDGRGLVDRSTRRRWCGFLDGRVSGVIFVRIGSERDVKCSFENFVNEATMCTGRPRFGCRDGVRRGGMRTRQAKKKCGNRVNETRGAIWHTKRVTPLRRTRVVGTDIKYGSQHAKVGEEEVFFPPGVFSLYTYIYIGRWPHAIICCPMSSTPITPNY